MNLNKKKSDELLQVFDKIENFLKFLDKEKKDSEILSENIGKK